GRTFNTINDYIKYVTESKGGFTKIVYDQTTGDVIFQEWNEVTQKFENVDNSKFSTIVKGNETITTLVDNQDGTYTYTSEDGTTTLVDIPSSVVNQFETIVKQPVEVDGRTFNTINDYIKYVTESKGGFTKIVYDQTTGDVIFQEWNKVTQKFENVDNSKFSTIVKGNETITLLVPNTNGTFTYYNESQIGADGQPKLGETGVTIDPKEVSVSLNTTTNKYEFKNSQGDVIGEIDANANAIVYNDNTTNLGVTNVQEAIEKLLDKITEVAGTTGDLVVSGGLEFLAKTTGIKALLADVTIQVADEGITNDKLGNKAVTSDKLNAGTGENNRVGVADDQGNVIYKTLDEVVKGNETVTLLIPNTNGTFTYYNESQIGADGQPKLGETGVTIDPKEVSVSLNTTTNKYEFKNSQGDVIGEIDTNAKAIAFDNSTNGFTSTNVQEALEELKTKLDGTSDTLVNNNDGTYTHTTVAGDVVVIDANTTKVEVLDGVYTFKNAKGDTITSIDTNAKAIAFDDSKSKLGADNVQDAIDNLLSKVGSGAGVTLVDNNDGTITLKSDDNTVLGTVSKGSLTNNNDGTYTYDNGDGTPVTFDTNAKAIAFDNSTNGFTSTNVQEALEELKTKLDGTSDTLVNNNDGTYTHTTVAGDVVVIDANTTKVEVLDGVYTFKNAKGDTITSIDTNAKAIAFDNSANGFTSTNVQEALEELKTKLDGTSDTLVNNNDGTYTHTTVAGDVVIIDANTTKVEVLDGVYTFKNAKGDTITSIDTNAKAIVFDNSNNGFTSTNVQEALEELKTTVDNTKGDLSLAGGLEFITGANGTDKLLADAGIQIADKGITTDKIKPGTDGQILVTEGTGDTATTKWVNKKSATSNTLVTRETAIVSSVNGEKAELILEGDAVLKEGKTVVQAIQGTLVSDTKPSNAQTLIYDQTTQAWIPGTPDVTVDKVVDAKTLTTDGVIVIGTDSNAIATTATKSLLTDVKLNIANNKITTDHIQNGTIKPEDIANAGNNQVLVTDNTGVPTWKNQTDVGEIVTANNGLTKADTNIQLGGLLTKKTAINTTTDNTLALTGLDKKKTQAVNESEGVTQHLLAVDKNGDVIKALKAAMPKFFYMPSVMVPTAESQAQQEGVTYNNTTRTGTIDMYAIYKKQFGSPVMSSTGASALPVLPASELGFHVTYATEGVFTIVSINAEGLMTYKVNDTANVNIGSFINIVFSVNEDN
ncbi:beta strand repeat-containing protein, partial [Myroides odoratimimus]